MAVSSPILMLIILLAISTYTYFMQKKNLIKVPVGRQLPVDFCQRALSENAGQCLKLPSETLKSQFMIYHIMYENEAAKNFK